MVAVVPRAAHAFSVLALGWTVSRFQRFCRFAARETGTFDSARSSMAQLSMGDRLPFRHRRDLGHLLCRVPALSYGIVLTGGNVDEPQGKDNPSNADRLG